MIVFNDINNIAYKVRMNSKKKTIPAKSVKRTRRILKKNKKITKENKEFLRALGFKI